MRAYIYNAALLCEDCADKIMADLNGEHKQDTGDSGDYPQGPYEDGGGEADTPQHCDACHAFLENPLTKDGVQYVCEAVAEDYNAQKDRPCTEEWAEFYDIGGDELAEAKCEPRNCEVFYMGAGEFDPNDTTSWMGERAREQVDEGESPGNLAGWYYWWCMPGCLPDSDAYGPYDSHAEALASAWEEVL